ncbi:hypothetical protein GZH49_16755 [Nocardia terpenica]|uniref:hypothetical protein n=1 Tax=Nocardia terpenica TaxID=455432 RepID=UPI002FE20FC2
MGTTPWDDLKNHATSGGKEIKVEPGVAEACAQACSDMIAKMKGYQALINNNGVGKLQPLSYLRSGTQLANDFNGKASELTTDLDHHIQVLSDLVDTFKAAGKAYSDTDKASADALDKISATPNAAGFSDFKPGDGFDTDNASDDKLAAPTSVSTPPAGLAMDTSNVSVENGESLSWNDFVSLVDSIDPDPPENDSTVWSYIAGDLDTQATNLVNALRKLTAENWTGYGGSQAVDSIQKYGQSVKSMSNAMDVVGQNLDYTAGWLYSTQESIQKVMDDYDNEESESALKDCQDAFKKTYQPGAQDSAKAFPTIPDPYTNTGQPPGNQPPGNKPPGNQPPGNQPPGNQPPGNQPPGNQPPGNQPPGNQPPGNQPPGSQPPGNPPNIPSPVGSTPPGSTPPGSTPPGSTPPGSTPPGLPNATNPNNQSAMIGQLVSTLTGAITQGLQSISSLAPSLGQLGQQLRPATNPVAGLPGQPLPGQPGGPPPGQPGQPGTPPDPIKALLDQLFGNKDLQNLFGNKDIAGLFGLDHLNLTDILDGKALTDILNGKDPLEALGLKPESGHDPARPDAPSTPDGATPAATQPSRLFPRASVPGFELPSVPGIPNADAPSVPGVTAPAAAFGAGLPGAATIPGIPDVGIATGRAPDQAFRIPQAADPDEAVLEQARSHDPASGS